MSVRDIYLKIIGSPEYQEWHKENPKAYLVHFLFTQDDENSWQVGFYEHQKKEMATFEVKDGNMAVRLENDIFRKDEDEPIKPLVIDYVKKQLSDASEAANQLMKETYKNELPLQSLFILQNINNFDTVWNATIFTKSFKTMNVKMDAATGEIKSHELAKLFDFDKGGAITDAKSG